MLCGLICGRLPPHFKCLIRKDISHTGIQMTKCGMPLANAFPGLPKKQS
ncbi:MAG: hypothetical protein JWM42_3232 [Burkholderia sp.]|jgi:hypothetical protein|nr:hypothetical protein [Burkholderia sp.]